MRDSLGTPPGLSVADFIENTESVALNNEIANPIATAVFLAAMGLVASWHGLRLRDWREVKRSDDGSASSRKEQEALSTRLMIEVFRSFAGLLAFYLLLDWLF